MVRVNLKILLFSFIVSAVVVSGCIGGQDKIAPSYMQTSTPTPMSTSTPTPTITSILTTPAPTPPVPTTSTPIPIITPDSTNISKKVYTQEEIEYFKELTFGVEYGPSTAVLHKWTENVRIKVYGMPTSTDLDTLRQIITELNNLMNGITLSIVENDPNVDIHFVPISQFPVIEPNYVTGNDGFFWVWWDGGGTIYKARILIATDIVTQQQRSHLIREELTQSLGLMKDSLRYPDSIFYQGWTATTEYTPIDRAVISLLYEPRFSSGMNQNQFLSTLQYQE